MNAILRTFFPFFQMEGENTRAHRYAQVKHVDIKRINVLRMEIENTPDGKDTSEQQRQIEEIEAKYPDYNSL